MSKEVWKAIKGYDGLYEVSSHGRVRSFHKHGPDSKVPKLLAQGNLRGYRVVNLPRLYRDGRYCPLVHRLVAFTFIGDPPKVSRPTVNHRDLDKANNRVDNLEWMSHTDNNRHAAPLIPRNRGEQVSWSKLNDEKVRQMRQHYAIGGITCAELGAIYGVSDVTAWQIIKRKKWVHVP